VVATNPAAHGGRAAHPDVHGELAFRARAVKQIDASLFRRALPAGAVDPKDFERVERVDAADPGETWDDT
jgi:hypothetical protein